MAIDAIFPLVEGLQYGLVSTEAKRAEDSIRAGENAYLPAVLQIVQVSTTLDLANKALEGGELAPFSWVGKSVIYLTPILLAGLKNRAFVPEKIRPILTFFQNHLSSLYQVVNVISSIALLFFGYTLFALSCLFILGIGFMDRNGWLPLAFRQSLHRYQKPLLIGTALVSGGILNKIFAALNLLSWYANRSLPPQKIAQKKSLAQGNLDPQKMTDFFNGNLHLTVNQSYIHYNPFPPVPNIDIQSLVERFDQINWKKHLPTLRQKLKQDRRFIAQYGSPHRKTDQEIIAIGKHSLQTFISTIKERRILQGEPADYEKLHNYLKLIAKYVQDQKDEILRIDVLFRLVVEGGEYCGPGKFEVAESVYAQTIGENPDIPFRDKVLHCLQDERNLWMQNFYFQSMFQDKKLNQVGKIVDWEDIHNYNVFLNLYGDEFGLRKAAADNDDTALIDPLFKWIVTYILGEKIQHLFWNGHSLAQQTETVTDSLGTPKLPKPEFYDFWLKWIDRQKIDEPAKEALKDELMMKTTLYDRPIEVDGKVSPEFVSLMLFDMGIAKATSKNPLSHSQPLRTNLVKA